ncbi:MAG: AEC family transporter [Clostridia bacterium]|nr:AEC family transporter [Clostridia bacterium]
MSSFSLVAGIVAPMFLLMLCGWLLRQTKTLPESAFSAMNKLCFVLLLPASLVNNLIKATDFSRLTPRFLLWLLLLQAVIVGTLFLVVPRLVKENPSRASIIQAGFRSNFLVFGLVIAASLVSSDELALVSVAAGLLIPLYNIGGILILQHYCGGKTSVSEMLKIFIKNPFVIACIIGLSVSLLKIPLPTPVNSCVNSLAGAATTVSFIALGGCTDLKKLRSVSRNVIVGTVLRLVVLPVIVIGLTVLAGFRGIELLTVVVMAIAPTAVATFPLAERMHADGPLAGYLVVSQSVFSIVTIFVWLLVLNATGLV